MLQILGRASSLNVRKVLWTCTEIGLEYDRQDFGTGFDSVATPEFLALNPNGQIPVIVDGDTVMWESNTICRYLTARAGRTDLLPAEPELRARVEQWMDWQATELNPSWGYAFSALVRQNPDFQDVAQITRSVGNWSRMMAILDGQLARTNAYVVGPEFSLADIVLGLSVNRWLMTPMERPDYPAISAYVERLKTRPGFITHGLNGTP